MVDESDAPSTTLAAISPKDDGTTAASPDDVSMVEGYCRMMGWPTVVLLIGSSVVIRIEICDEPHIFIGFADSK